MRRGEPGAWAGGGRVLIVEEQLRDDGGHFGNFVRGMAGFLRARGAEVEVWAHREARADVVPAGVRLRRVFAQTMVNRIFASPRGLRPLGVARHNARLLWALLRGGAVARPPALAIVPCASMYHVLAWRCWLALTPGRCRLVLVLLAQPWFFARDGRGRLRLHRRVRWWFRLFGTLGGAVRAGRCCVANEVALQGRLLRRHSGLECVVMAVPPPGRLSERLRGERAARAGGPRRFGFVGAGRPEKGLALLAQAIRREGGRWRTESGVAFVIHCQPEENFGRGLHDLLAALAAELGEAVEVIEAALTEEDYARLLLSLDAVLLPYQREHYRSRGSGIVAEAACAGLPMVCTQGTWLEGAMRRWGAGVTCRDGDAASLAAAIAELARDFDTHAERARARAGAAQAAFTWENFFAQVAPETLKEAGDPR